MRLSLCSITADGLVPLVGCDNIKSAEGFISLSKSINQSHDTPNIACIKHILSDLVQSKISSLICSLYEEGTVITKAIF